MDTIIAFLTEFTKKAIAAGCTTKEAAFAYLCNLNPSFRTDEIVLLIFPNIFGIEYCRHMILTEKINEENGNH